MALDASHKTQFEETGQLTVKALLSTPQLETLRDRARAIAERSVDFPVDKLEYEPGTGDGRPLMERLRKINEPAQHDPVFREHAADADILDIIEDLLGPDVKLFGDQMFVKPPGGVEKTYHQDSAYFHIEPMAIITAWVALDDATLANGCLRFIPGSHRQGVLDHSEVWMVGERQDQKIPDAAIDLSRETPILLTAGDCSFHHSLLLHRSGPNDTDQFRRGMASHYMSARSRWTGPPEDKPDYPLLRGQQFPGYV